ncbi:B12-binding domain-containing radical SAM protein [Acidaminobacter sp. JC074]|uniref:B12-binding domain-containing radical SAM protein n=1 Tax=Acidaminobacter sp. JC074 TaxID=2530199 RepID=UPI001F0FF138|nr:radical SAM protein [Acidaminobacter sp. JC074]MCH4887812.1 B12-binding domain-containing radical SAM protein [Acidaminobacter sp. JC074]
MKIAIISPAGAMHRYTGSFKKPIHYAPLTLTTIAGILSKYDIETQIYDETIEAIPKDIEADMIIITVITGTAPRSYAYGDYYRSRGIKVVMGGVHPSILPQEAKAHCDSVLIGLGEVVIPKMLIDFKNKDLKAFYKDDRSQPWSFSLPDRTLLPKKKYITNSSLEASRGCTNDCSFCAVNAMHDKHYYTKDLKVLVEEIEALDTKGILFVDVNLVADRDFAIRLFKALIPLKKWWFGLVTADVCNDDELFNLMVKSGCKGLLIGFESISEKGLQTINKYKNHVTDYSELMKKMHSHGISINGTFVFGTDEDKLDVFDRTVEMVQKLKIDLPRYSILTPFPGTKLYDQLLSENRITDDNWAMFDVQHVVHQPKHMTRDQLTEGFIKAWRDTYSNSGIIKRIFRPSILFPLAVMTNQAYRHYADRLETFDRNRMIDNSDILRWSE